MRFRKRKSPPVGRPEDGAETKSGWVTITVKRAEQGRTRWLVLTREQERKLDELLDMFSCWIADEYPFQ